jgi:hypothetical protein
MKFSEKCIDLIETQKAFEARYEESCIFGNRFGFSVVQAAHEGIGRCGVSNDELRGINRTLLACTGNLQKRVYIWIFPLSSKPVFSRGPFGGLWESENVSLLVESLIATVLTYRNSLWEFETNLAQILLSELTCGFELICDWIVRGVPLDQEKNDLIKLVNVEQLHERLGG